jgi:hypothetical protein
MRFIRRRDGKGGEGGKVRRVKLEAVIHVNSYHIRQSKRCLRVSRPPNNQIRKEKYCVHKMDFKACNFGFAV